MAAHAGGHVLGAGERRPERREGGKVAAKIAEHVVGKGVELQDGVVRLRMRAPVAVPLLLVVVVLVGGGGAAHVADRGAACESHGRWEMLEILYDNLYLRLVKVSLAQIILHIDSKFFVIKSAPCTHRKTSP